MKYIIVIGSNKSSFDEKNLSCHIGKMIHERGLCSTYLKIDPHLNYCVGRIEPGCNGEVYVLQDGAEVDLDLGVFERMCEVILTKENYLTLGKVLFEAIQKEKESSYDAKVLRFDDIFSKALLEHVLNLSKAKLYSSKAESFKIPDYMILDFGSDLVDPEMIFYIKAICRTISTLPKDDVSVILNDSFACDFTNSFVDTFRSFKVHNDILIINSSKDNNTGNALRFSIMPQSLESTILYESKLSVFKDKESFNIIARYLNLEPITEYPKPLKYKIFKTRTVGIISRYSRLANPYASVEEALITAGLKNGIEISLVYINYMDLENGVSETLELLRSVEGILLPGGFGSHGIDTKISIAEYARVNNRPFLGICLGYQIAIIEFARNVLKLPKSTSREFDPSTNEPVIEKMQNIKCKNTNEDIYLGTYSVEYLNDVSEIYPKQIMSQRFRHRYGLNKDYKAQIEDNGMKFVAKNANDGIVMFKIPQHRFYVGVQYHPELGGTTEKVDPVFTSFVASL